MIPVGARYKQLGRPTHFRSGHQNPINEASLMIMAMEMIVILEMMMIVMGDEAPCASPQYSFSNNGDSGGGFLCILGNMSQNLHIS